MLTSHESTSSSAELHFPVQKRLSFLARLLLPREWKLLHGLDDLSLPPDPVAFLQEELNRYESAIAARLISENIKRDPAAIAISESDLVEFAIQTWRLHRRVEGMDPQKHEREYKQFADSVRRFVKFLERFEVEFEDPVGKPFTTGWLEVEVVTWDEPGDEIPPVASGAWVKQTVSPIVRRKGITIKAGQVICVERD